MLKRRLVIKFSVLCPFIAKLFGFQFQDSFQDPFVDLVIYVYMPS